MISLLKNNKTAIGIDIGSRTIKAAQLDLTPDGHEISALAMIPRLEPGPKITRQDMQHLRRVLRCQGFVGHNLIVAVPEEQLLRGHFDLPQAASGAPISQLARMELSRIHHVEPNSFELIHWGLPTANQEQGTSQTVAVACPHEAAEHLLNTIEASGFDVQALDVRTAATARACQCLTLAAPALTAILDLGWSSTKLMLTSGATVMYERLLNSDLGSLATTLSQRFGLDGQAASHIIDHVGLSTELDDIDLDPHSIKILHRILTSHFQSLTEELSVPFSYATHQYQQEGIQRMLLTGGGARIPGLAEHLTDVVKVDVRRAAPSDLLTSIPTLLGKADNPAATVAVGLSLFSEAPPHE